jgi:hypothetical protein
MRKIIVPVACAAAAVVLTVLIMSTVFQPLGSYAQTRPTSNYGEDRAAFEDLQARYLFALDFHDPDLYVSTFTEDGILDYGRYWFHYSNDNPEHRGVFDGFGHYEDELIKTNGKWLFTKRHIYNEGRDEWAYKGTKNPAW